MGREEWEGGGGVHIACVLTQRQKMLLLFGIWNLCALCKFHFISFLFVLTWANDATGAAEGFLSVCVWECPGGGLTADCVACQLGLPVTKHPHSRSHRIDLTMLICSWLCCRLSFSVVVAVVDCCCLCLLLSFLICCCPANATLTLQVGISVGKLSNLTSASINVFRCSITITLTTVLFF